MGLGFKPPRWLKPGEECVITVEGIGQLRNPTVAEALEHPFPQFVTHSEELAVYAIRASYFELSAEAREKLKAHVLDSIGCAIGALTAAPIEAIRAEQEEFPCPGRAR